jgi:bifunctional enzyme CysN/CysC
MVTGASVSDVAIVLVDARKGLVEQSHRHAFITSLLRVPHLVLAINKMDLVDYSQDVYEGIYDDFVTFATKLDIPDLTVIPISALHGDNIVTRSENMPWYTGATLLHHLEHVYVASDRNMVDVRFPVQYVIRPQSTTARDYRGYAGQVNGGVLRVGDEVLALPSGFTSTIAAIDGPAGPVEEAHPPMSVVVRLADEIDISRGDMLCRPHNKPHVSQDVEAMVCWMTDDPLREGRKLAMKHTTRQARAMVKQMHYRLDVNTLHRDLDARELRLNDIGRIRLRTTQPILADEYRRNRYTGGFILVDEATNFTVAAGMIVEAE